jgi:hypothetical protein
MSETEILETLQGLSIEQRINLIEEILRTLKRDVQQNGLPQTASTAHLKRPTFGFMQHTGKILGDIVEPVLPETSWDVLQ